MDDLNTIVRDVVRELVLGQLGGGPPSSAARKRAPRSKPNGAARVRKLTPAGRKALSLAAKRRWAAFRAGKAKKATKRKAK